MATWLQLQSTTFVENTSPFDDDTGGITDPNPTPVPDPDPVEEVVNLTGYLTKSQQSGSKIAVTLSLPRVLPVNVHVNYKLRAGGSAFLNKSISILSADGLSYKTLIETGIVFFNYSAHYLEIVDFTPATFEHEGVTYNLSIQL